MRHSLMVRAASLLATLLGICAPLAAQEQTPSRAHTVSITMSAVPAIDNIAQFHAEFASSPKVSLAAIVGAGSVEGYRGYIDYERGPFVMLLAGMQANYYLVGDFENGMQVGAQALLKTTHRDAVHYNYYRGGTGVELVPYLGYKVILGPGITLNAQAGIGTMLNKDFITTSYTELSPDGKREGYYDYVFYTQALLHLNLGWSF